MPWLKGASSELSRHAMLPSLSSGRLELPLGKAVAWFSFKLLLARLSYTHLYKTGRVYIFTNAFTKQFYIYFLFSFSFIHFIIRYLCEIRRYSCDAAFLPVWVPVSLSVLPSVSQPIVAFLLLPYSIYHHLKAKGSILFQFSHKHI